MSRVTRVERYLEGFIRGGAGFAAVLIFAKSALSLIIAAAFSVSGNLRISRRLARPCFSESKVIPDRAEADDNDKGKQITRCLFTAVWNGRHDCVCEIYAQLWGDTLRGRCNSVFRIFKALGYKSFDS